MTDDDRALVERQLGRSPRAFLRVVVRCAWGRPAVTEQAPYDVNGEPFPTTYYLTCPYLVAAIARVEAAGGVARWTAAVERDPELAADLERANAEQREVRRRLAAGRVGADGGRRSRSASAEPAEAGLKCLHAHAAYALARPGYELGECILAELGDLWPEEACCMERPPG